MSTHDAYVNHLGRNVRFRHRDTIRARASGRLFRFPPGGAPPTPLPVDNTGNHSVVCLMDGNDAYGDCGEAMVEHVDNVLTYRRGAAKQSSHDVNALVQQYFSVSGGDNGLDEPMVVNDIWTKGIAGDRDAVIVDSLDIDVTDTQLARFCLDNFGHICMAFSCPNAFLQNFRTGARFSGPATPNPMQGHYVPLFDVGADGFASLYTWGSYCWVDGQWIETVQAQCFVGFSPRQFDRATGLDAKGRHVRTQAALWQKCGGNATSESVLALFPPITGPTPTPSPVPVPTPTPDPQPVQKTGLMLINFEYKAVQVTSDVAVIRDHSETSIMVTSDPREAVVPASWTLVKF